MSYSDFISTLNNAFSLFTSSLFSIANTLISNYFFITILGVSLFLSLVYFLISNFQDNISYVLDDKKYTLEHKSSKRKNQLKNNNSGGN